MTSNAAEMENRWRKATKLAAVMLAAGVEQEDELSMLADPLLSAKMWEIAALKANVNPPSEESKKATLDIMREIINFPNE